MAALPGVPGLSRAVTLLTGQAKALTQLPRILLDLNRSVLRLAEAFMSARDSAMDTLATVSEATARLERIANELEEPLLALRPGIERLARVLDDDALDTLPDTLRGINEDVLPLLKGLRETQSRVNSLATVLPGASLLFPRRPRGTAERVDGEVLAAEIIDPELD